MYILQFCAGPTTGTGFGSSNGSTMPQFGVSNGAPAPQFGMSNGSAPNFGFNSSSNVNTPSKPFAIGRGGATDVSRAPPKARRRIPKKQ